MQPVHALILLHFAENCSVLVQDAFQGLHGNKSQATLHPVVIYQKKDDEIATQSFCILSDSLQHDTNIVHHLLHIILEDLKANIHQLKQCIYLSNGAVSQYKNYTNFSNICHHEKDMLSQQSGNLLQHHMEKVHGVGGTVNPPVSWARLQLTIDAIDTVDKMLYWCKENINGI